MSTEVSKIHSHRSPRGFKALPNFKVEGHNGLTRLGIGMDSRTVDRLMTVAMDSLQNTFTTPSIPTPAQFLQEFLPGVVYQLTTPRSIDTVLGVTVAGNWYSEEIIVKMLEHLGKPLPYGDTTNIPLASWNPGFERRTVVRFELGFQVGPLEEARAGVMQIDSAAEKRIAAAEALDIIRNEIAFFGYNGGLNRTYGFLNDPSLPAYVAVPQGASGSTLWSTKTFLEITRDIRSTMAMLRTQSRGRIDPRNSKITIAVGVSVADYLTVTSDQGVSVEAWLTAAYPGARVIAIPELDAANGGQNVMYVFGETIDNSGTDDSRVFDQIVPAKFRLVGTESRAKGLIEDYMNASAGIILKRPLGVVRRTGI